MKASKVIDLLHNIIDAIGDADVLVETLDEDGDLDLTQLSSVLVITDTHQIVLS